MLVPEEEAPQEDDIDGSAMAEDDEGFAVMQVYLLLQYCPSRSQSQLL